MEDSAYPPCGFHGVLEPPFSVAVADGVGGLPGGEVASSIATRYVEYVYSPESFVEEIGRAHLDIQGTFPGSATTLTLALVQREKIDVYWIGDSTALVIFTDGTYKVLTRPHVHPATGYILRVLGMGEPVFDNVSIGVHNVHTIMLFTDGLTAHFSISEIVDMYMNEIDLVQAYLEAGAIDNVAIVIAKKYEGCG